MDETRLAMSWLLLYLGDAHMGGYYIIFSLQCNPNTEYLNLG